LLALRTARDVASQVAAETQARAAALEERRIAATAALHRIDTLVIEVRSRVNTLRAQIESSTAERTQREQENIIITEQLATLIAERASVEAEGTELQQRSAQLRQRL